MLKRKGDLTFWRIAENRRQFDRNMAALQRQLDTPTSPNVVYLARPSNSISKPRKLASWATRLAAEWGF